MCLVRMKQEGRSGKYMCRIIVHFMWEDVEQRGRIMGVSECYQILVLENSNEGLPDWSWSFICSRMAWCQVVIHLESLLPLWRLACYWHFIYVFAHITMVCQCEYILCTEMGLLSPNHGDRRDGFGEQIKSNNNNPVLGHFAFDTSSVCQFTISLDGKILAWGLHCAQELKNKLLDHWQPRILWQGIYWKGTLVYLITWERRICSMYITEYDDNRKPKPKH